MKKYLVHNQTKTVKRYRDGRIIFFSYDDFLNKIVKGNCCFICGVESSLKAFNNEHVIPNWILKYYGTQDSFMILPNDTTIKNSIYKVPCCCECNNELGKILEIPMSNLLRKTYEEVCCELDKDNSLYHKIFHWACLLVFKTHLKDSFLSKNRDKRSDSGTIGDDYCWHQLFRIHNIVRHHHTNAIVEPNVFGTVIVLEALIETKNEDFGYLDNLNSETVLIKVGKIVVICVLNDSKACLSCYQTFLSNITGSLASIQIRELFARIRYVNENLKNRPDFYFMFRNGQFRIGAKRPDKIELLKGAHEKVSLGKLMRYYIEPLISNSLIGKDEIVLGLEKENIQCIFDEQCKFKQQESYNEINNFPVSQLSVDFP